MKVAVAKYAVGTPARFDDFAQRQSTMMGAAAAQGAAFAVLPEYLALELAAGFGPDVRGDPGSRPGQALHASLAALQPLHDDWRSLFGRLARDTGMTIVAGSFLLDLGGGRYRNRAYVFAPDGRHDWQDKLQLTGFEKKAGGIEGGDALKVFETGGLRFGVAVCYDIEFPLPVRAQCEAGARLLLVPSCTDTAAGATRVRVGCLARALENRCFVAQAVTAGEAAWSPALDVNTGEATLYAPMDVGLPDDGIVAQTEGEADWSIADLDFDALEASRAAAQVANDRDWMGQGAPDITRATVVPL